MNERVQELCRKFSAESRGELKEEVEWTGLSERFDTRVKRSTILEELSKVKEASKDLSTGQGRSLQMEASKLLKIVEKVRKPDEIEEAGEIADEIFEEAEELGITEARIKEAEDMRRKERLAQKASARRGGEIRVSQGNAKEGGKEGRRDPLDR